MPQRFNSGSNNHSRNSRQKPLGRAAGRSAGFGPKRNEKSGDKSGFGKRSGFGRSERSDADSSFSRSDRPAGGPSRFSRSGSGRPSSGRSGFGKPGFGHSSDRPRFNRPERRFNGPRQDSAGFDSGQQNQNGEQTSLNNTGSSEGQERRFNRSDRRPGGGFGHSDRKFDRPERKFGHGERSFNRDDRGGERSFNRDDRGGERSFNRDNRGGERSFNRDNRGGERSFNRDNRGGERSFNRDDRGGERSFNRDNRGGERSFNRDDRGGERIFNRDDRGGERSFNRDNRGGERSFNRDNRGGERSFNRDDRGGERRFGSTGRRFNGSDSDSDTRRGFRPRRERDPDYDFFHPRPEKKFDPANPEGFEGEREPYVFESVKTEEEPRGRNMTTGFSPNDNNKRTRRPLKRYTDGTAEGRQARKEQQSQQPSDESSVPEASRRLPTLKYRAKAEKRAPRGVRAKKEQSEDDGASGIRLQKVLAAAGLGSRRNCEELISAGRVEVDGEVVSTLGACVQPGQKLFVDGVAVNQGKRHYFVLNKPEKFICSNADPDGRARAIDLVRENVDGLFAVGRLDMNSRGLLLITNDGELAFRLTHPSWEVQKVYRVHVSGIPSRDIIQKMCEGIYIAEGKVHADKAKIHQTYSNGTSMIEMVLSEGKNREIRRILARLGHNVLDLTRIAIGPVKLGSLPSGAYRRLNTSEVRELKQLVGLR